MTPPDDTPPKWLEPNSYRPGYLRMVDELIDLCETQVNDGDRTLPEWLAWRSRVAEALGLVECEKIENFIGALEGNDVPVPICYLDHQDRDAIANELRRAIGAEAPRYFASAAEANAEHQRYLNKTIAAELRRLADAFDTIRGDNGWKDCDDSNEGDPSPFVRGTVAAMDEVTNGLRDRADELEGK